MLLKELKHMYAHYIVKNSKFLADFLWTEHNNL